MPDAHGPDLYLLGSLDSATLALHLISTASFTSYLRCVLHSHIHRRTHTPAEQHPKTALLCSLEKLEVAAGEDHG